ncbi:MAG: TraB/GumN family protein [Myxococcota bacterium]
MRRGLWPLRQAAVSVLCCLGLLACATLPESGRGHPTLWRAQRGAATVYLLGSVHLGTPGPPQLGPGFEQAWSRSAELVVEVDGSLYDEDDARRLTDRYGRVPTPGTLRDRVSLRTWTELVAHLDARGVPVPAVAPYRPWLVSLLVSVREYQALGQDPESGLSRELLRRAYANDKPVVPLETLESRFALFAGLPDPVQELMLRDALASSADFAAHTEAIESAWRDGRDRALRRLLFPREGDADFAPFYENVVFARSRRMADRVADLSADGETRLMVVGVVHMLGKRGIPALLAERGFEVKELP